VRAREQLLVGHALRARSVVVAELGERAVGRQAVGVDDRLRLGRSGREGPERVLRCVGEDLQAQPPRAVSANFDRDADEGLLAVLATALESGFMAPDEAFVDLVTSRSVV